MLKRKTIGQIFSHLLLIFFSALFALPLFWLVSTSLKPNSEIFIFPPRWIPSEVFWGHYRTAIEFIPFFRYLFNTLYICAFSVLGSVISCSLVAYGFARIDWPERNALFMVLIATMMIPFAVTMIPMFIIFNRFRWINTFRPLIVPTYFAPAFYVFLLRQFFMTIPFELSDAARIDGASEFYIYLRIILPLARPALAVVALFQFIGSWNDSGAVDLPPQHRKIHLGPGPAAVPQCAVNRMGRPHGCQYFGNSADYHSLLLHPEDLYSGHLSDGT